MTAPARPVSLARRALGALGGGLVAGALAVMALHAAPPAQAYWADTGTLTTGAVSTWALTNVQCPNPTWGSAHVLSWTAPAGSVATVSLTTNVEPSSFLGVGSSWTQATPRPGVPQTTTAASTTWGISTTNAVETTDFHGTWTLTVAPPSPTGGWSATATGTWQIDYATVLTGTATCTVAP